MDEINQALVRRYEEECSDRAIVQQMWDAVERFVTPYRGRMFDDERNEGSIDWFKSREIFDSTAVHSHANLANRMHGDITSPAIKWFELRFKDKELQGKPQAVEWLQGVGAKIYNEINDSNFDLEINETYQDLCGFGTNIVVMEEKSKEQGEAWGGIKFTSIPMKQGYFEPDECDRVGRFYRLLKWSPAQIIGKFGDDAPDDVKELDEKGSKDKLDVLYCIFPRGNKTVRQPEKISIQAPSRRPWEYRYIYLKDKSTLKKGGFYEQPAFAPRYATTSESQWGHSPAMKAMADILSLNSARKMQLRASEKIIDPPVLAEERAIVGHLDMNAAALSVVRKIDAIAPFVSGGNIAVSDHMITQLQESVARYFHADQLHLPPPQGTPLTATEIERRYELMQRLLGPTLARLRNDLLDPIIERAYRMLVRAGQFEEPPEEVIGGDSAIEIYYLGPLARAQRVDSANNVERVASFAAGLTEAGYQNAALVVDEVEAVTQFALDLGVPANILRDKDAVEAEQNRRQQLQKDMDQAAVTTAQNQALGGEDVGPRPEEGGI